MYLVLVFATRDVFREDEWEMDGNWIRKCPANSAARTMAPYMENHGDFPIEKSSIWVNLITTSLFSRALEIMVSKGNDPQIWPNYSG